LVQSATATGSLVFLLFSIAYWSSAESIIRKSFKIRLACERLRARMNPGTAMAASKAMIATTIMISTRVNPLWFSGGVLIILEISFLQYWTCHYIDARYDPSLASCVRWNIIALVPGPSHFSDF